MSADNNLFLAGLRPNYRWAYFNDTLLYSYQEPENVETCLTFLNVNTLERVTKYMRRLVSVAAQGEYCAIAGRPEDDNR